MKDEPEIVKILREEERSGKFQFYFHCKNDGFQTFYSDSDNSISYKSSDRKISHRITLSKKNLFTAYKMMATQRKTIRFDLNRLIEPIKSCDVIYGTFDIFAYKMKKLARSYDISAYKKYQGDLKDLDIVNAKNILHIGCGSYPATAMALANLLDAKIVALDKNPRVIKYAKNIIRKKNLEEKITVALGNAVEYPIKNFDVIIIGGACCPKKKILYRLFEAAKPQTKIIFSISIIYYKLIFQYATIPDNILIEKKIKSGWTFLDILAGNYGKSLIKWLTISFIKK